MLDPCVFARRRQWIWAVILLAAAEQAGRGDDSPPRYLAIQPTNIELEGNFARVQVLVARGGELARKTWPDLTRAASYRSTDEQVFVVDPTGLLTAIGDGAAWLRVEVDGFADQVPVKVRGVVPQPAVDFDRDVRPLLSKAGCNAGACHAAQYGKGGFKLSVFGFDPGLDYRNMVRDRVGRRINLVDPASSLLLAKPTMAVAHGGGLRLSAGSLDHQLLVSWLRNGAPGPQSDPPQVERIALTPERRVGPVGATQQLRVVATYSDGSQRDVTRWAKFDAMDESVLQVSPHGLVTTLSRGQAAVMARFEAQAEITQFAIPFSPVVQLTDWSHNNYVDRLAAEKFRELGIEPSPLCDDSVFVRRAYLDAIGTLPTPSETKAFLESNNPQKRTALIDRLLGLSADPRQNTYNDEYAAYWTLKWSDLIRNTSAKLGEQGMWALHNWIRESFRNNKPFDQFVSELVTATGSIYSNGPANYYRINQNATDLTEATSQLFLGVRLECAKCHHHPFESFGQADYYGFAAFFARVGTKRSEEFGLFGREQVVMVKPDGEVKHPKTGQALPPTPLRGESRDHPLDRRIVLAQWLTSRDNKYFARAVVNRYVSYLLGNGLVEPVDDLRSTNPPTNEALMEALAQDFVASGFDLKQLARTIMTSRLYQLSSQPSAENAADTRFFSHYRVKRLPAEVLLDAIDQVTGTQTKFRNLPRGTRAIDLPDAQYPNYFLNTFAKPRRASVCECERPREESLSQALHTLNGDTLAVKIADKSGRVAAWVDENRPLEEVLERLYLLMLSRYPTAAEIAAAQEFLATSPGPSEFYEDLMWALINSKQFLFVR